MTETHECLLCKKITRRKTNFCCGPCQKQYIELHKTNIDYYDWDYIDTKIPNFKFVFKNGPIIATILTFSLNLNLIQIWFGFFLYFICAVYAFTSIIRFYRL
jgi:hypothetical protein